MTKRAPGEGSVYKRASDGMWVGSATAGWVGGRRQRKLVYSKTQKGALEKLSALRTSLQRSIDIPPERLTVGDLLDQWMNEIVTGRLRDSTRRRYLAANETWLRPHLGRVRLKALTPVHVQRMLNVARDEGQSPRSVHHLRTILGTALNQAIEWGYLERNVAKHARIAVAKSPPVEALTSDAATNILAAVQSHRLASVFALNLATGMRQGELLGLRWVDVNIEAATVTVMMNLQRKKTLTGWIYELLPTKEDKRRDHPLSGFAVEALRKRRIQQLADELASPDWDNAFGLVFTTTNGRPVYGPNLTRQFHKLLIAAKIPDMRFHSLRHGTASLLLAQGVPMKTVSEMLGHETLAVTADLYGHLVPEIKRDAATAIDRALKWAP